jgi:23S rRNA pseudouridine1911/1915/1917 synthase
MTQPHRISLTVTPGDEGLRLDRFCASRVEVLSRNQVQTLNGKGGVTVDGDSRPDSYPVRAGEVVEIDVDRLSPPGFEGGEDGKPRRPVAQDIVVPVVFEDAEVVVVNKPAGMVVHPAHGNWDGTLVNALLGRGTSLSTLGSPERPGVVHRLDKDTSGLMVLAKTDDAYRRLATSFKDGTVRKVYHAIVWGGLPQEVMSIDAPIGRHPVQRQRMAVVEAAGKAARTELFVVDRYTRFDYIRVTTLTGRTHQIRVHLTHIGHPLLGDPVYGGRRRRARASNAVSKDDRLLGILRRHALHASRLSFQHPSTREWMSYQSALPADMRLALETIHRHDRIKEV